MTTQSVLIAGQWREADATEMFHAVNPSTREKLADAYPVSSWSDCNAALEASATAAVALRRLPAERIAKFLEVYADRIEARKDAIAEMANLETALPTAPRLADVELPRTTNQLRLAAAAAREGSWTAATIDTGSNIRSYYSAIGTVAIFGPNNFPLAFGSVSGGDFAAAIAAGNPVIGKANSSHPGTTRLFAEEAHAAVELTELPTGTVQLIYRTSHGDGKRLVSDPRIGATGYTGSRSAGLKLKAAADATGKPIYLELSAINPVVILPGALDERGDELLDEFVTSSLMGTGQFCTNPGIVVLLAGSQTDSFVDKLTGRFESAPVGTLLSSRVSESMEENLARLIGVGAELLTGGQSASGDGFCHQNTLLRATGAQFLERPSAFQTEVFGNASLLVVAEDLGQLQQIIVAMEGSLTGCIYSADNGSDDGAYDELAPALATRVGRLLNDKMPTGVAVSPAMHHGGPYPATGHPGFTAVGIPASLSRFAQLQCYDNVRPHRLPAALQDQNPNGNMWRLIDGSWTQADVE
jgi:NADP-dependent aldehyde dehydrogenase